MEKCNKSQIYRFNFVKFFILIFYKRYSMETKLIFLRKYIDSVAVLFLQKQEKPYTITRSKLSRAPEMVESTHAIIKMPTIIATIPPMDVKLPKLPWLIISITLISINLKIYKSLMLSMCSSFCACLS